MSDAPETPRTAWRAARLIAMTLALVVVIGVGWFTLRADEATEKFCTADGLLGPNGQTYGRDADQGCAFVDEHGNPIPVDGTGRPIIPD